ncbi:MAG: division/cell wall cluster transcriptional repressor MraZ [Lentimicrobiaceae bacterium]|jgi:MraZ protein|nr:division/cell wall cluster transcriptional repressor MraZ [Lentimicrobiaceae bacterium]MCP4909311.1 division/cell wall cluster transcriptional repressor MraZ [Bacteroidota bacterium]MBT3454983.1 division/cell wall cluster transcriptional repressor MraZ [Lentimicrobiaceae bacterium]MBT3818391.1 division/cell wall cluster transcriptional repressor MraZ [Lentimicrobiaceae bacterium]MBT4060759.1 division/cell wall cluster transcriptional repressor MraZ [Lentimicrobiaceae bacterium]
MVNILGTYECKVDSKGRFMFPVQFKGQLGEAVKQGMVIKRSIFKQCLELFPMENWREESLLVNKLNMFKKKNAEFATKFMAGVKPLELDGTGRLLIPKDLISYSSITKEIVLTSVVNRIEIWDKSAYEVAVEYNPDDFADLAEEVMGEFETE